MSLLLVSLSFLFQLKATDPALAARIHQLLQTVFAAGDDKQEAAAVAEAKEIFTKRGLPSIAAVGDDAAYEFVLLTCSAGPLELPEQVLKKARVATAKHEIPTDAATYCEAHVRQERAKSEANLRAPGNPDLREHIEKLFQSDQAVREQKDFDAAKMAESDRAHTAALNEVFEKYGVPTYAMVGPQAASDFVVMVQHQSPEFRRKVLPKLKANVDAGQADPGSYAMVFDRLQTDAGKPQVYGENLVCDTKNPKLHVGPIEDEKNVNQRRAAIGLMRLELYAQLVVRMSPAGICPAAAEGK